MPTFWLASERINSKLFCFDFLVITKDFFHMVFTTFLSLWVCLYLYLEDREVACFFPEKI